MTKAEYQTAKLANLLRTVKEALLLADEHVKEQWVRKELDSLKDEVEAAIDDIEAVA